jgi:hypothetical protein
MKMIKRTQEGVRIIMPLSELLENRDMVTVGERIYYLSLAMDARRALNAIRAVSQGEAQSEELRNSIRAATESLEALSTNADLYAKHSPDHYVQYEEIQTLREISVTMDPAPLIQSLRSLLSGGDNLPSPQDLSSARRFFRVLESHALHQYNDPGYGNAFMA